MVESSVHKIRKINYSNPILMWRTSLRSNAFLEGRLTMGALKMTLLEANIECFMWCVSMHLFCFFDNLDCKCYVKRYLSRRNY